MAKSVCNISYQFYCFTTVRNYNTIDQVKNLFSASPRKIKVEGHFRSHSQPTHISRTQVQNFFYTMQYYCNVQLNIFFIFYKSILLFQFMLSSKSNSVRGRSSIEIYSKVSIAHLASNQPVHANSNFIPYLKRLSQHRAL